MSLEEAVKYALSDEEPTSPAPEQAPADEPPAVLTSREREIALFVAQGLTNRQIATELVLSEHTVATHVRAIFKKLGFHSRTQVATWLIERQPRP